MRDRKANAAAGYTLDAAKYLDMPHAVLRLGNGVLSVVEAAWHKLGFAPRIGATATSFSSLVFMVTDSLLIATVQRRLARQFSRMLPIRIMECPIPIESLEASMSWHLSLEEDPAHRYLRNVFADTQR